VGKWYSAGESQTFLTEYQYDIELDGRSTASESVVIYLVAFL